MGCCSNKLCANTAICSKNTMLHVARQLYMQQIESIMQYAVRQEPIAT